MQERFWGRLVLLGAMTVLSEPRAPRASEAAATATRPVASRAPGAPAPEWRPSPLRFESNAGQWDARARFVARTRDTTLFVTDDGMVLRSRGKPGAVVTIHLVGAAPVVPTGERALTGLTNYFVGNDPGRWRTGVPAFGQVRAVDVLPGVSMLWHGGGGGLEYDVAVAAGTDASRLELAIDGARALSLEDDGALRIDTPAGPLRQEAPRVVQAGRALPVHYRLDGGSVVGFRIDGYRATEALLIDPVLAYSTYLGGTSIEHGNAIAVDAGGSAYVVGQTDSADFPTLHPVVASFGGSGAAYVTKLSPTGALVYSTFLAGESQYGYAEAYAVAVDPAGSAYVTGVTGAKDFPTASAFQSSYPAGAINAAFVTKLSPAGDALAYSTYLGGGSTETGYGIAVDTTGSAYVAGMTESPGFPTVNAAQSKYGGNDSESGDAFITKLSPSGTALVYSTFLGGTQGDLARAIAVDAEGSAYVCGGTSSKDFPTVHALQPAFGGGIDDAFVAKLSPAGSAFVYATYLGGGYNENAEGIAVDAQGSAYVAGWTISSDFPFTTLLAPAPGDAGPPAVAMVAKVDATGSRLSYATALGVAEAAGIAVDAQGAAYVAGETFASDFPVVDPVQPTLHAATGSGNGFVMKLNAPGTAPIYSTYLGGSGNDDATGIAIDSAGSAYVTGEVTSRDFPTVNAAQPTIGSPQCCLSDAFVAKIGAVGAPPPPASDAAGAPGAPPLDASSLDSPDDAGFDGSVPAAHDPETPSDRLVVGGCGCQVVDGGRRTEGGAFGVICALACLGRRKRSSRTPRRSRAQQ